MSTNQSHHSKKSETETAASSTGAAEALKLLDQVIAALALPAQTVTSKQRKAATRSRKGMERVVPTLATLSAEHGVSVPKQPTSTMTSDLELVSQLEAVQQKLTGILTNVGNNVDATRSTSWNTASTLYGMLQKVAHRDPQLKSQLTPVTEFFAYRTPAAKKAHPKQKGKKEALAKEKEAAAQPAAQSSAPSASSAPVATPSVSSAPASPTASAQVAPVTASVAVPHS
jgi:hypothetical protein